jgi:hypothetical protein
LRPSEPLKIDVCKVSIDVLNIKTDVCKVPIDVPNIKIDVKNLS